MQLRVTVEVFGDKEEILVDSTVTPIASGTVVGNLDIKRDSEKQPILSVRMRNIIAAVQETIYKDSNS